MTTERLLTKKNLLNLCAITLFSRAVVSLLPWFVKVDWLYIVDYCVIGLTASAGILYFAVNKTKVRFQPAQVILIFFLLWLIISCISMTVVYQADWVDYNCFQQLNTALSVFLIFPMGYVLIREGDCPVGRVLLHILLLSWTLFILYIIVVVFQGKAWYLPNDGIIFMDNSSSLRMNCNRNTTGSWEMVFFLGCCFMAFWNKRRSLRIVYSGATLIHYVGLMLSGSRACILAVMAGFTAFVGIKLYMKLDKQKEFRRLAIAATTALLAGAAYYLLRDVLMKLYSASASTGLGERGEIHMDAELSGRDELWRWTIQGIFSSFRMMVFGITPQSVPELISQMSNRAVSGAYSHNQLLEITAAVGFPGLILFLGWFGMILKDMFKLFFRERKISAFWAAPVVVLVLLAANMMEAYLVFFDHIAGYTFFLLCGMIHGKMNDPVTAGKSLSRQEQRRKDRQKQKGKKK